MEYQVAFPVFIYIDRISKAIDARIIFLCSAFRMENGVALLLYWFLSLRLGYGVVVNRSFLPTTQNNKQAVEELEARERNVFHTTKWNSDAAVLDSTPGRCRITENGVSDVYNTGHSRRIAL